MLHLAFWPPLLSEGASLRSGPMLGYSTFKEVTIWVQTDSPATVQIKYWDPGAPESAFLTDPIRTEKGSAYVAHCVADRVRWNRTYAYAVLIDGEENTPVFRDGYKQSGPIPLRFQTQPRWRHAKEANFQPPDFRVALGSCAYINEEGYNWEEGTPYGSGYGIFESIYEQSPDLMVWLGDNIYLREADWTSPTGLYHRYTHFRSLPYLRALFATAHHYAIWDDHDYGPNDSGYDFWNKEATRRAFQLFWANPSYGFADMPGTMTFFNWGDVNFYLLDNRTYRVNRNVDREAFGQPKSHHGRRQVDWLVDTLTYQQSQDSYAYPASFNIICTGNPVLNDSGYRDGYRSYSREWQYMIDRIMQAGIDGVVFLSGDIHYSELSRESRIGGGQPGIPGRSGKRGESYVFHDLTVSPLTSGVYENPPANSFRVDVFPDSERDVITQHNFATLDFTGPKDDRRMEIRFFDEGGRLINQRPDSPPGQVSDAWILKANDLQAP